MNQSIERKFIFIFIIYIINKYFVIQIKKVKNSSKTVNIYSFSYFPTTTSLPLNLQ